MMDSMLTPVLLIAAVVVVMGVPVLRARLANLPHVAPAALQERLAQGEDMLVLDVRTPEEFAGGHIQGAVNVPVDRMPETLAGLKAGFGEHRNEPVVVVCQRGPRAVRAAAMLKGAGLTNVALLSGGMNAWSAAGLAVRTGA